MTGPSKDGVKEERANFPEPKLGVVGVHRGSGFLPVPVRNDWGPPKERMGFLRYDRAGFPYGWNHESQKWYLLPPPSRPFAPPQLVAPPVVPGFVRTRPTQSSIIPPKPHSSLLTQTKNPTPHWPSTTTAPLIDSTTAHWSSTTPSKSTWLKRKRKEAEEDDEKQEKCAGKSTVSKRRHVSMASSSSSSSSSSASSSSASSMAATTSSVSSEEEEDEVFKPKWTCAMIRGKIRAYLALGHTQTAFRKAIGNVNSNSYRRFMQMSGSWQGRYNGTFVGAHKFFLKKEKEKKRKKKKKSTKSDLAARRKERDEKKQKKEAILALVKKAEDEGYEEGGVLDDCNDIRRKINAFFGKGIMNRAEFLRAIGGAQHSQLTKFLGQASIRGAGAANKVYRMSYHFFEKLRIAEGKPKSKKRLENEAEKGTRGFPLRHDNGMRLCLPGERLVLRRGRIVRH